LAIVTGIQAVEAGRDIILLPITAAARFQHRCIVQNANFTDLGPADLAGKQVAVRAYSQTTGAWVRTILDTEYGVDPRSIEWLTQEAPHVVGAPEPENVIRDPDAAPTADLLREGRVAAAILGNDMPKEDWVRPVIPDPEAASQKSFAENGVVNINHVVAVSRACAARDPGLPKDILAGFERVKATLPDADQALLPLGPEEMRISVETLLGSVHRQGLTRRLLGFEEVFGEGARLLS
jgi:4,5-dihydroxyphthalate decarboxylase